MREQSWVHPHPLWSGPHLFHVDILLGTGLKQLDPHLPSEFVGIFCLHHLPLGVIILIAHFKAKQSQPGLAETPIPPHPRWIQPHLIFGTHHHSSG